MLVFIDQTSREIFAKTYAAMLKTEADKDGYKFDVMVKREMLDGKKEAVIRTYETETNDDGISGYFDWAWYPLDDDGNRKNERPFMNGGWVNHGTVEKPDWSSHS